MVRKSLPTVSSPMETSMARAVADDGEGATGFGVGAVFLSDWKSRLKNVTG